MLFLYCKYSSSFVYNSDLNRMEVFIKTEITDLFKRDCGWNFLFSLLDDCPDVHMREVVIHLHREKGTLRFDG